MVKTIKKILLNLDEFYGDILEDLICDDEDDYVHGQIRNGLMFEGVSQCMQSIEELFALLKNSKKIEFFAKNTVTYSAASITNYIRGFKTDEESIAKEFRVVLLSDTDATEKLDYDRYKKCFSMIQDYTDKARDFYCTHIIDYNQYKHGTAVGLSYGSICKDDNDACVKIMEKPLINSLVTFHNGKIEDEIKKLPHMPAVSVMLRPEIQPFIRELDNEKNLFYQTFLYVDYDDVLETTKQSCELLEILWKNLLDRDVKKDGVEFDCSYLPSGDIGKALEIGIPKEYLNVHSELCMWK